MADNMLALPEEFKVEVFKKLIDQAPAVYVANKTLVDKALISGEHWLKVAGDQTTKDGHITDELDAKINEYLVKIKDAHKNINSERSPITSFIETIPKLYTTLENSIDITKPETIPAKLQIIRNKWATYKIKIQKKEEDERQRILLVEKVKVNVRSTIEIQLNQYFNEYESKVKKNIITRFESITLENAQEFEKTLKEFEPAYPKKHYDAFVPSVNSTLLSSDEIRLLTVNVTADKFSKFADVFRTDLTELKQEKIDHLPSKYRKLEEIAQADENRKKELLKKEEERKLASQQKADQELADKNKKAEKAVNANKEVIEANLQFDNQLSVVTEAPNVKESINIVVLHPLGYKLIIAKYFDEEGILETVENLNKKTLLQMKTFCEKHSLKTGDEIKSQYLRYETVYKAKTVK